MKKEKLLYLLAFLLGLSVSFLLFRKHDTQTIQKTAAFESIESTPSAVLVSKSSDREKIAAYLAKYYSPMLGTEDTLLAVSHKYGIDYRLMLGIARKESSLGKRACNHNPFGIASCRKSFKSFEESYEYLATLLTQSTYYADWRKTGDVFDLIKVYCPESDGCNTHLYVRQLKQFMNEL